MRVANAVFPLPKTGPRVRIGFPVKVSLDYGRGHLEIDVPEERSQVITPRFSRGLPDERGALLAALHSPVGAPSLAAGITPLSKICIVFTDITRATPNERLIPWLLEYLEANGASRENITLLNSTGTHRGNTPEELRTMLTPRVVADYRVVNHDCRCEEDLVQFGFTKRGSRALINRHLAAADIRIITGFIEPHFFAGFSGGPKGIMPGVAGLETIISNHGVPHLNHAEARFGITEGNPLWEELRDIALRVGPAFLVNVSLNHQKQITGIFAGDLLAAHRVGTEFVREASMCRVDQRFDVVISTNSGYPLDMNLYQAGKGMRAASLIAKPGGAIIMAAECSEGVPAESPYEKFLHASRNHEELAARFQDPNQAEAEQWGAHIQSIVRNHCEIFLHSRMPDETVRACHLEPCPDIQTLLEERLATAGPALRLAVLPHGPLTIPYVAQ